MCFSAGASFATSAVLLPAGAFCLWRAASEPARRPLAAIPVLFSLQQACEGLVWRGLERGDPDEARLGALAFLLFALVLWPFWIPLCGFALERRRRVRRWLGGLMAAGLSAGLLVWAPLLAHAPERLRLGIAHQSIRYDITLSPVLAALPLLFWQIGYVALVTSPLLLAGRRGDRTFALLLLVSAAVAQAVFWYAFISVWCAFAAILSAWLCYLFVARPDLPPLPAVTGDVTRSGRAARSAGTAACFLLLAVGLAACPVRAFASTPASAPASAPVSAPATPAGPPLGRGHVLFEVGQIDVDDAAAREWGVNREGFFALAGYWGDARGIGYMGGEIGHAATGAATTADGDRIEDFDLTWIELNGKRAFGLGHGWSADAGFGGSFFFVDGQEVSVQGGLEIRDPLADLGFGLQVFGDVTWRVRRLLLGVNVHYQWAFDLIDIDYSNLRFGGHIGIAF